MSRNTNAQEMIWNRMGFLRRLLEVVYVPKQNEAQFKRLDKLERSIPSRLQDKAAPYKGERNAKHPALED